MTTIPDHNNIGWQAKVPRQLRALKVPVPQQTYIVSLNRDINKEKKNQKYPI